MEKLVVESKNLDELYEKIEHSSAAGDDVNDDTSIVCNPMITPRRKGICFTHEEDNCIILGIKQLVCVGLRYCAILNIIFMHVVFQIL